MEIKFVKINPTQNMTILVESPIPREGQHTIASQLMDYDSVFAEQVGFIEAPLSYPDSWARIQMMGGEFCGNATLSLAALLCIDRNLPLEVKTQIPIESSGTEQLIRCEVTRKKDHVLASLTLPAPSKIESTTLVLEGKSYDLTVVYLDGIIHIILPVQSVTQEELYFAEKAVRTWQDRFETDALGLMLLEEKESRITPLVYVKSTDSLIWERGCGSGTAATGAYLAYKAKQAINLPIAQPGGEIIVKADYLDGSITTLSITGKVKIAARGIAYL